MREELKKIKERLPLLDYLRQQNWTARPAGQGPEFVGLCPLHPETRPSFHVNAPKNLFYCHGCGQGGDLIRFVELSQHLSFRQSLTYLEQHSALADPTAVLRQASAFYQQQPDRYPVTCREGDLTSSTLLKYVKFQSSQQPPPSGATINNRVAVADRALRNQFPNSPCQVARGFHQPFLQRRPLGLGRPRVALSRLRVRVPKRPIVPLSVEEVARFWSSFRTARDLALVGLMLLEGLRSAEVLALNEDDVLLSEAQLRVRGKGNKLRFLPLAPETVQLLDHYRRLERPHPGPPRSSSPSKDPRAEPA